MWPGHLPADRNSHSDRYFEGFAAMMYSVKLFAVRRDDPSLLHMPLLETDQDEWEPIEKHQGEYTDCAIEDKLQR